MEIKRVELTKIGRYENSRATIGDISELMSSIKEEGLLTPLIIAKSYKAKDDHEYILVAGNRRYEALKKLGIKTVECFVKVDVVSDKELMITNLTENIQRKSTTPYEEGRYMYLLSKNFEMSVKEIAVRLGTTVAYVNLSLKAYKDTPEKYRDKVVYSGTGKHLPGKIPVSLALRINTLAKNNKLPTNERDKLYDLAKNNQMTEIEFSQYGKSLAKGYSIQEAIELGKHIVHIRCDVPISVKDKQALIKKYPNISLRDLMHSIIYGEIKEPIKNPYAKLKDDAPMKTKTIRRPKAKDGK